MEGFASKIAYIFREKALLRQALTHRSFGAPNNERLEFLGDSILNCVIADALFRCFPKLPEGELSRLRANLVNQQSLCEIAKSLDIGSVLLLGEGEVKSNGQQRPSILADALEAVFGAVFLDGGFDAAACVVGKLYEQAIREIDPNRQIKDPKTQLQEYLQSRKMALPRYDVVGTSGEAHRQHFRVECCIAELGIRSQGEGESRRGAEQSAASAAYSLATQPNS
ncbi:MAG: ribonuclease III [Burkholderiales bacterium]|nr:ribonuclease III [Burkholderiales bacterium]